MHKPQSGVPLPETSRPGSGRRKYPFETMEVGEMFFAPNKKRNTLAAHTSARGKQLGRKFAVRELFMAKDSDGVWQPCEEDDEGATLGVGVWRTE